MVKLGSSASPARTVAHFAPDLDSPKPRKHCPERKVGERMVAVCIEALTHPDDRLVINTELRLGKANIPHPTSGAGVARRKAERLVYVSFGFCASTKEELGQGR